jgi:hypothetical protein
LLFPIPNKYFRYHFQLYNLNRKKYKSLAIFAILKKSENLAFAMTATYRLTVELLILSIDQLVLEKMAVIDYTKKVSLLRFLFLLTVVMTLKACSRRPVFSLN